MTEPLLNVRDVDAGYGGLAVLHGVNLSVSEGELVALVGPNGAGKSTMMRTIVGLVRAAKGSIHYGQRDITNQSPHKVAREGLSLVLEERGLFAPLTVSQNLRLGLYAGNRGDGGSADGAREYELVYGLFPVLHERRDQVSGTLSGGEQKMLAVGRALMSRPSMLLLDEPCAGLAPILVDRLYDAIRRLHEEEGLSVLVVEQNVRVALQLCQRAYVITNGVIRMEGQAQELMDDPEIRSLYLGGA